MALDQSYSDEKTFLNVSVAVIYVCTVQKHDNELCHSDKVIFLIVATVVITEEGK